MAHDTHHNNIQNNVKKGAACITYLLSVKIVMLSVILLSVLMLSVVILCVIMLSSNICWAL